MLVALAAFGGLAPAGSPLTCFGAIPTIRGTAGNDVIKGTRRADVIVGRAGNDRIFGRGGNDRICGGKGNDRLGGNSGLDRLDGGPGIDTVDYSKSPTGVRINLGSGRALGDGGDRVVGIENVIGSRHPDLIRGSSTRNVLSGLAGRDDVFGAGGDDSLRAGGGNDYLSGGAGADTMSGGPGRDGCRQGAGEGSETSCEFGGRPERENVIFFYQKVRPGDGHKFANASAVVLAAQGDLSEWQAVQDAKSADAGVKVFRYVQFYWLPAGRTYEGIDIANHPDWRFCMGGAKAPLVGRVVQDTTWYMIDANERGAYAAIKATLQQIKDWGYDGVFFDRGEASLHSLAEPRRSGGMWSLKSACTEEPVSKTRPTFSDAYVRLAQLARRDVGLEVLFNYGKGPFSAPKLRPSPRDRDCRRRDWRRCSYLNDVWPLATKIVYEGASDPRTVHFHKDFMDGRLAEQDRRHGGIRKVVGLTKVYSANRRLAFYQWARARLFAISLAINTGDDRCLAGSGCARWGTYPELTQATIGDPIDRNPTRARCNRRSTIRCVWTRRYDWGLVAVNVSGARKRISKNIGLPSCRHVKDVFNRRPYAANKCTSRIRVSLPAWSGRVFLYDTEPWS